MSARLVSLMVLLGWIASPAFASGPALPPPPPHGEHDAEAGETLAPDRGPWAPLPLFRGQQGLLSAARAALHQPQPLARRRGALVLGLLQLPQSRASLRSMATDPDREVRLTVGVARCLAGDAAGLPAAVEVLRSGPPWLRYYACYGLWLVNTPTARRELRASYPGQSSFLTDCLAEAVSDPPGPLTKSEVPPLGAATPEDLWLEVANALVREGDWWWHKGNYEQAIRCQEAALFFDPGHVALYGTIGWLQWSLGRHGEAVSTYRRGLLANPTSWEAADELATYYDRHHQREIAEKYYALAARLGSPAITRHKWGHVLEALGRYEEAREAWRQVLQLDPNDPIAKRQLQRLGDR